MYQLVLAPGAAPGAVHINRTPIQHGASRHHPAWSSLTDAPGHSIPEEAAVVSTHRSSFPNRGQHSDALEGTKFPPWPRCLDCAGLSPLWRVQSSLAWQTGPHAPPLSSTLVPPLYYLTLLMEPRVLRPRKGSFTKAYPRVIPIWKKQHANS